MKNDHMKRGNTNKHRDSNQTRCACVSIYAAYAVFAHLMLGFLVLSGLRCWNLSKPWEFVVHVLTSPKLYFFGSVYGCVAWVALIILVQVARKLFRGRWARSAFVLLIFCYWRPFISLIGCVIGTETFDLHWLWGFPLAFGWSPAILLWLLYRKEDQMKREQSNSI